ncbi:DUF362 domain-containing protein [Desulfovibrio inopinatus]|uniref:DUF362 domain-containing protein n=1 Tax=Desulfovibrio inopinatus TaxID=102109 RepID=UPI00040BECF3|nr:DUF362 domain-containing protein [Desulfovibrio inopinatus]
MKPCIEIPFRDYETSVPEALDAVDAATTLARQRYVLVKPNLVNDSPHPVTTHPAHTEAVVRYVQKHAPQAEIIIAEGCGDAYKNTSEVFAALGYDTLARKLGVELVDLNEAELETRIIPDCPVFPQMHLPRVAFTHFILSLPVLKAHSLAEITGTLKNMLGFAPPKHYAGVHGVWKKAIFHGNMQQSIRDLNQYVTPHLSVLDASIGLADYHLGGRRCDPSPNAILAGTDASAVDIRAAELLGLRADHISHIQPTL